MLAWRAGGRWSAAGCPVGDEAGDGQVGFVVVFAAAGVALQGSPLLVLGVGVLNGDPPRRLGLAGDLPAGQVLGRSCDTRSHVVSELVEGGWLMPGT